MAANEVIVKFKLDSDQYLKALAADADKAAASTDNLSKSARTQDRALKGAAQHLLIVQKTCKNHHKASREALCLRMPHWQQISLQLQHFLNFTRSSSSRTTFQRLSGNGCCQWTRFRHSFSWFTRINRICTKS